MNVLIVHAHYEPQSFTSALKNEAVKAFSQAGHAVKVSDLYAMGWNPVASAADFQARKNPDYCTYALEQRHAEQTGTLAEDIRIELDKVAWCDLLILNFPMFWFTIILQDYTTYLSQLETVEPLKFPSLDDFDDTMHPK